MMRSINKVLTAFPSCVICGDLLEVNNGYLIDGEWFCDVCGSRVRKERQEGDKGPNEENKTEQDC